MSKPLSSLVLGCGCHFKLLLFIGAGLSTVRLAAGPMNHGPYSPDSTYSSEAGCRGGRCSSNGVLLGLGGAAGLGAGNEAFRNQHFDLRQRVFDFDMKRIMGFKAMERASISGELRTPNANWIGLALSRTSPAPLETADDNNAWNRSSTSGDQSGTNGGPVAGNGGNNTNKNNPAGGGALNPTGGIPISPYCLGAATGVIDSTPINRRIQLSQYRDIHFLLTTLGLEHYIKTFITVDDLIQMGTTAFDARKKLLVAIHTIQANEVAGLCMPSSSNSSPRFSRSAAPSAERRTSNGW